MLGALLGDIVGSTHEWSATKTKEFDFYLPASFATDDSYATIAVASCLLDGPTPDLYRQRLHDMVHRFPEAGWGGKFYQWALSRTVAPYNSWGNGSAMRFDLAFASPPAPHGAALGALEFARSPGAWRVLVDLAMIGVFGGFYIVPLYALIQSRAEPGHQSRIIAGNNILNALFMVVGAVISALLLARGLSIPQLFLVVALMNAAVAVFIFLMVPEFLMRFIAWLLVKALYRVDARGLEHVPEHGAAVVVANHVSFVDAVVLMGMSPRPIRFVMDHQIFKVPVLSFVFRTSRAIPIAPRKEDPALMERAFQDVRAALEAGDLVGVFPEGGITRDGRLAPFRPGITRILEASPVPVVPMAITGLWGSFFSRVEGRAMKRPFRRGMFNGIRLSVGPAIAPAEATPERLHDLVAELRGPEPGVD